MATVLGKRKARTATADAPAISPKEAQEMLRRHFEAQFQPLDIGGPSDAAAADRKDVDGFDDDRSEESNAEEEDEDEDDEDDEAEGSDDEDDDDDNDEWGGLSDSDAKTPAAPQIEVVEHVSVPNPASARAADPALRRETKAYLSSRVPTASALAAAPAAPAQGKGKKGGAEGEDETSAALLRNDLALQRLLTESHLFTAGPLGGAMTTPEHAGRNRHLATDLRLAALGSKGSIYKQAKMPMAHRKGIIAAAETRDAKRRREARENGIVLEKPTAGVHEGWTGLKNPHSKKKKGGAGGSRMRDAAVDAPAVGKLRNGMLQLSKKDVQSIQGDGGGGRRGAAGGGKRRRR